MKKKVVCFVEKIIAGILVLSLFQPCVLFAENVSITYEKASLEQLENRSDNVEEDFKIVEEVIERRNYGERHFICEDGGYVAVSYGYPVNYRNDNGDWIEIDNTLVEMIDETGNQFFKNKDGLFDICFSGNGDCGQLVSINKNGVSMSWNITAKTDVDPIINSVYNKKIDIERVKQLFGSKERTADRLDDLEIGSNRNAESEEHEDTRKRIIEQLELEKFDHGNVSTLGQIQKQDLSNLSKNEQLMAATKATSEIIYNNAFSKNNINVIYEVSPTSVKESIVLECVSDITTYEVELSTKLIATLLDDGSIVLHDYDSVSDFMIAAPVMFDSAGSNSCDIAVTLTDNGDDSYSISYIPSLEWLLDDSRVYPVYIDPTVTVGNNTGSPLFYDTYVVNGGGNYSDSSVLWLADGTEAYFQTNYYAFPNIPAYSDIQNAYVKLYLNPSDDTALPLQVYRVTEPINISTVQFSEPRSTLLGTISSIAYDDGRKYYQLPVTSDLSNSYKSYWKTGVMPSAKNYKIVSTSNMRMISLCSSDYSSNTIYRPALVVQYNGYKLDIPSYYQKSYFTCGPSCFLMTMQYFNADISYLTAYNLTNSNYMYYGENTPNDIRLFRAAGGTVIYNINKMNRYDHSGIPSDGSYLSTLNNGLNGTGKQYQLKYLSSKTNFVDTVGVSLSRGYPVVALIRADEENFGYSSNGHFILITGLVNTADGTELIYNDPYYGFDNSKDKGHSIRKDANVIYSSLKRGIMCA